MSPLTAWMDASGTAWRATGPPRRIVSLIPSVTETHCALGLADALVGVTVYCVEPAAVVRRTAKIGGEKNPDLEKIRALRPDLVVANVEENVREHVETLRAWGIAVWVTYPRTVAEGIAMIRELGAVTGTAARAEEIAGAIAPMRERAEAVTRNRRPVRVFYPIWRSPYMTINADTYVHDMLRVCGATNVFGERSERYPTVTLDEVAAAAPEVILLPDEPFRFRRVHRQDFAPWPDIPAVRHARIHLVDGKLFCWYGPRIADALGRVPALVAAAD